MRELYGAVEKQGVALDELARLVEPHAITHFGRDVQMECRAESRQVQLFAAFTIKPTSGPAVVSLERADAKFGVGTVQVDDVLVFQVFFTPEDELEARAQDVEYLELTGLSCVGCGFWPVARHVIEERLGLENPGRSPRQRVLTCAIESNARFVLRRTAYMQLVLKELVEVRRGGEVEPFARGRRDLAEGSVVEITRRTVDADEVLAGLQRPQLAASVGDDSKIVRQELEWVVKHVRTRNALLAHVASEAEGRFLP
ncbi:MAG: hypothetical protein QM817_06355 [Archangium sp.]